MTGPEHYRKAEGILDDLRRAGCNIVAQPKPETVAQMLAEAQVHATLALAASNVHKYVPTTEADRDGWTASVSSPDADADPLDNIA